MKYYEKNKLKAVPVHEAVGKVLLHDVTKIVPEMFKGPSFKKGHIIQPEDIEELLDIGKKYIYVTCIDGEIDGEIHENDAGVRIANSAIGNNIALSEPNEGKVGFTAQSQGLLKINIDGLTALNSVQDVVFSTLHTNQSVEKGQKLAGTRVIPLSTDEKNIIEAENICKKYFPIIDVKPFIQTDVGIVITGSEVYTKRISDGFGPVIQKKFEKLKSNIIAKKIVSDELDMTVTAIKDMLKDGAKMIAVTGGMSVDPDDQTPAAIKAAGGKIVSYGVPVLPGAMFMLAYINDIPIIGLPGCVMYYKASIFDLIVPRLLVKEKITKSDIVKMGHGGFCSSCKDCKFPLCSFGK